MSQELYDVTILGAGPCGMYAAYYAGFRKLKTKVIDSLGEVGGQITALYPEKSIYDVGGFPDVSGKELVTNLERQMMQYNPTVVLEQQAQKVEQQTDGTWIIRTHRGEHHTRTLIISSGLGIMNPRRLEKKEFEIWEGKGLSYVMSTPHQYTGKNVMIVGGGDSAVDWANHLAPIAKTVYVVHRRDQFRAHEGSVEKMRAHSSIKAPAQVKEIRGGDNIAEVVLTAGPKGPEETLAVDAVLAFLGFVSTPGPIAEWGLALDNDEVVINQRTETNLPGIYAIGDCATYGGKVKLISVGFGEAAIAVNHAAVLIDPKKRVFPGHSSNQK